MNPSLQLMPFQQAGADRLAVSARAMLVWDMGVGKTPTAIRAAVQAGAKRILVLCPPIAVSVWREHFLDWSYLGAGVQITPYSKLLILSVIGSISRFTWDAVIIDEAHYLKNSGAKRTKAVYGPEIDLRGSPLQGARHIWALTGTPVLNHPAEFWSHLRALRPDTIMTAGGKVLTESEFLDRFCVSTPTSYGVRITGGKNTNELVKRLKPFIDRKRIVEVLHDLPALRIVTQSLPPDTPIEPELRDQLIKAVAAFNDTLEDVNDEELLQVVQAGGVAFSTVRRLIGHAKVEGVAAIVDNMLSDDGDGKVILFAHHRDVIRDLAYALKKHAPLVITGDTPFKARENAIDMFQTDPEIRLIILAIEAAGESITLHAANNVVIAEPSPVPAKNRQAIARAHRKGQKNPVLARFVLLPGTLDARLTAIIARKTKEIAELLDSPATV